jgi:anti-sigma-K factor RskA
MDKEQLLESGLLEQYVLGLTTEEESQVVEELAAQHEEVRVELSLLRQAMDRYATQHGIPDIPPPPSARAASVTKRSFAAFWPIAAVFALSWGVYGALQTDIMHQRALDWEEKHTILLENCDKQQQTQQALADQSDFLLHRHTQKVRLQGVAHSHDACAFAYWNPTAQKVYLDLGSLPCPPKGKTYQVWADVEGHMVNAGVIAFLPNGQLQEVRFIEKAESLNITLEPEGGSEAPTVSLLQANALLAAN